MHRYFWWFVVVAIAAATLLLGNLTHFTWWATIQYYGYALLEVYDLGHRYSVAYITQALLIIAGIVTMSFFECTVLTEAADEYGGLYILLNFLLHYLPVLTVIHLPPKLPVANYTEQTALGIALFAFYVSVISAEDIYGCNIPRWAPATAALSFISIPIYFKLQGWTGRSTGGLPPPPVRPSKSAIESQVRLFM